MCEYDLGFISFKHTYIFLLTVLPNTIWFWPTVKFVKRKYCTNLESCAFNLSLHTLLFEKKLLVKLYLSWSNLTFDFLLAMLPFTILTHNENSRTSISWFLYSIVSTRCKHFTLYNFRPKSKVSYLALIFTR